MNTEDNFQRQFKEQLFQFNPETEFSDKSVFVKFQQKHQALLTEKLPKDSDNKLTLVFQACPLPLALTRLADGYIYDVNDSYVQTTGYSKKELVGKHTTDLKLWNKPEDRDRFVELIQARGTVVGLETELRINGGAVRHILFSAQIVVYQATACLVSIAEDITDRIRVEQELRQYQERLKSLATDFSLAEEALRRQLSSDLHENLGQLLALSLIKIDSVIHRQEQPEQRVELTEIRNGLEQALDYTRTLTSTLYPPVLYKSGLQEGIDWLVNDFSQKHKLAITFQCSNPMKIMEVSVRGLLYRAVRELLVNIVKHAQARQVKVSMNSDQTQICITVEDDGVGFDQAELDYARNGRNCYGLFNISERLSYLGGKMYMMSRPDSGAKVTLMIPIKE